MMCSILVHEVVRLVGAVRIRSEGATRVHVPQPTICRRSEVCTSQLQDCLDTNKDITFKASISVGRRSIGLSTTDTQLQAREVPRVAVAHMTRHASGG